ncbi:MAG: tRNA (guanosine(46)-N7)-methyltransferase TrmB [Rickettsiales bacterium]
MHPNGQKPFLSSFGRNRGRSLSAYQQGLVDNLLPQLAVSFHSPLEGESKSAQRDSVGGNAAPTPPHQNAEGAFWLPLEGGASSISLEIGFGGGEHLLAQAAHRPDTLFIGCEPFINGVAKCLAGIEQQKLGNIRLHPRDARELILALPDACVNEIFILFPDPWPKLRHQKRRLVNAETLAMLHRIHKPGGRLLIATDHVDYSEWILERLLISPHYRWTAECAADFETPPPDWTQTKYQRKTTAEGREPVFMECVRI